MPEELKIDVAGAEAAMAAADINPMEAGAPRSDRDPFARDPAGRFTTPDPEVPAPVADATANGEPAAGTSESTPDVGSFTHIDDAAIMAGSVTPEMMLQWKKSLQADYTKKTMEVAEWRKLGERGLSVEEANNAAELYQRLQDPNNLPTFQQELSEYMQAHGMGAVQANQIAAQQTAELAPVSPDQIDNVSYDDQDPTLAPILQVLKQQQAQIERLTSTVSQSQAERAQQAEFDRTATRLTSEEQQIRAANPTYTDAELTDIYSLMGPEANLLDAQARYESMIGSRLARYIGGKESAHATTATPVAGGGVIPTPVAEPMTADQAHAAAMRHVAELDALDAQ